jgi:hypothetical protein
MIDLFYISMSRLFIESLVGFPNLADIVTDMLGIDFRILEDFITYDEIDELSWNDILHLRNYTIKLILVKWCSVFTPYMYSCMQSVSIHRHQLFYIINRYLGIHITKDIVDSSSSHHFLDLYIDKYWSSSPKECVDYMMGKWYDYMEFIKYPMNREIFDYILSKFITEIWPATSLIELLQYNQIYVDNVTIRKLHESNRLDWVLNVIPMHLRFRLEK